jgi:hypothetical protein
MLGHVCFSISFLGEVVKQLYSNIRNIYIKADSFPFMMLTAANKERKQI